jgi:hypothetical protein
MKVFDFDPREYAAAYRDEGYVHIREGMSREFHTALAEYAERELTSHKLDDFAIKGKKEQSLYDFPDEVDIGELYDVVCATCGLDRANVTLSERHIQIYEASAAAEPPPQRTASRRRCRWASRSASRPPRGSCCTRTRTAR